MARTRTIVRLTGMAVAALCALPGAASAADKTYTVSLSPADSAPSAAREYTATIRNTGDSQSLGSANLVAPSGFALKSASVLLGSASTDGSTVFLRNLALAPGTSRQVRIVADTSGVTGAWDWSAAAKQANDFNGAGNDFVLDAAGSNLRTRVTASAARTVACPEEPTGPQTAGCRLQITHRGFTQAGPYTVTASVEALPDLPNNAGDLTLQLPWSRNIECPGAGLVSPVTAHTDGPLGRSKTLRLLVDLPAPLSGEPGALCYAAPYPFATLAPGTPFLEGTQLNLVGTLLDCAPALDILTPCVSARRNVDGNHEWEVRVPYTLPDPAYRG